MRLRQISKLWIFWILLVATTACKTSNQGSESTAKDIVYADPSSFLNLVAWSAVAQDNQAYVYLKNCKAGVKLDRNCDYLKIWHWKFEDFKARFTAPDWSPQEIQDLLSALYQTTVDNTGRFKDILEWYYSNALQADAAATQVSCSSGAGSSLCVAIKGLYSAALQGCRSGTCDTVFQMFVSASQNLRTVYEQGNFPATAVFDHDLMNYAFLTGGTICAYVAPAGAWQGQLTRAILDSYGILQVVSNGQLYAPCVRGPIN